MDIIDFEVSRLRELLNKNNEVSKGVRSVLSSKEKHKIVWRLIYINLLGYELDFGWMEIMELVSSTFYEDKHCGFIAASTIFHNRIDLLRLLINTLKHDLKICLESLIDCESLEDSLVTSINIDITSQKTTKKTKKTRITNIVKGSIALDFIANTPNIDFSDNLFTDIIKIAEVFLARQLSDYHNIRSKAICCLVKLFQCCPDRLKANEWSEKLIFYFQFERNIDCLICLCNLIKNVIINKNDSADCSTSRMYLDPNVKSQNLMVGKSGESELESSSVEELVREWSFVVPSLIFTLYRIRQYGEYKDWKFHNVSTFWLQVKIVETLQFFCNMGQDKVVIKRAFQVIEDIFFKGIQSIKLLQEKLKTRDLYDEVEIQCNVGIGVEITKYITKLQNFCFPCNIIHLMGDFLLGLLYAESKDYASISISLLVELKSNEIINELIRRNLSALFSFTCSIDEDTTVNLLNILTHVSDTTNWKFISKEILNGIIYNYLKDKLDFKVKKKYLDVQNSYFFPGKAKTILEEIILSVSFLIKKFSETTEVAIKEIDVIFQFLEKFQYSESVLENIGLADNTLFEVMDILCDDDSSASSNEKRAENAKMKSEMTNFSSKTTILRFATFRAFKLLSKWGKCTGSFVPRSGMRWLCFLVGEYGYMLCDKVNVLEQVGVLLNIYDLLSQNSHEYNLQVNRTILLSFARFYCNSDKDIQNKIFELLKLGVSNRGNSFDLPELINIVSLNTQYNNTPIVGNIPPESELNDVNSPLDKQCKITTDEISHRNYMPLIYAITKRCKQRGNSNNNIWLSLCLLKKGILFQNNYLTISFINGNFKHSAGESIIYIKSKDFDRKRVDIENISILYDEKQSKKSSSSFTTEFDSLSRNLDVRIPSKTLGGIVGADGTVEYKMSVCCKGSYLNPPIVSTLLRISTISSEEYIYEGGETDQVNLNSEKCSRMVTVNFRLPVILTDFMYPTKKMTEHEFERFWEKFPQVCAKGKLAISLTEVPVYLQFFNFTTYIYKRSFVESDKEEDIICYGTSTLYLSNQKKIPIMVVISSSHNVGDQSESNTNDEGSGNKLVRGRNVIEIKLRSSANIVSKIIKQILVSYILAKPI